MTEFTVRALEASTWDPFAELIEANGGIFGGCWCIGFHPEAGLKGGVGGGHREAKHRRVLAGTAHAALVFAGDECIGWCQFGAPEEVFRIKNRIQYDKGVVTLPDWRVGCCFVGKGHRRQGVFAAGLAGALDLIGGLGGGLVEGYPESAADVSAGFLYQGALSTFEQLGFVRDRPIGKHRWVVHLQVAPQPAQLGK